MSSTRSLSMPVAILIGCGMIAGGLAVGLRGGSEAPPPEVVAPEAPRPPRPAEAPAVRSLAVVTADAIAALEYQRMTLRSRCPPAPGQRFGVLLNVTFDAQGVEVMRGLSEERGNSLPELTRCVTDKLTPLRVPPPGAMVRVEIPLALP